MINKLDGLGIIWESKECIEAEKKDGDEPHF